MGKAKGDWVYVASLQSPASKFDKNPKRFFYAGFTGKTPGERYNEHLAENPLFQGTKPRLISELSKELGRMARRKAKAGEAFVAIALREAGYVCVTDAQWSDEENWTIVKSVYSEFDYLAAIKPSCCEDAWKYGMFSITEGELLLGGRNGLVCETNRFKALSRLVTNIGKTFRYKNPNGRFALNASRQLIRKLEPPIRVDQNSVYVVAVKDSRIVTYDDPILQSGTRPLEFIGREIGPADFLPTLPYIDLSSYEVYRKRIVEICSA